MKRLFGLVAAIAICCVSSAAIAQDAKDEAKAAKLTIGSKAPELNIEHWVSDGDGKFKHTTKFEDGKVYLVEFWATWCGPCIASMPHISETQDKFAKKGFQVISVSDEDLETVEDFLDKEVRGDESGKSYGELTSNYCLTTDPDKSVYKDYMRAANQNGIPTAFIVGKKGHIEWIGHPMEMDEPLTKVLDDKWDRKEFAVTFVEKQSFQKTMMAVQRKFAGGDPEGAVEILEESIKNSKSAELKNQASMIRMQLLIVSGSEKAAKAVTEFAKDSKDAEALNEVSWNIYEMSQQQDVDSSIIEAATVVAEKAVKTAPKAGHIWDTLAHLVYIQGKLDKAIEYQKKAVKLGSSFGEAEMKEFLEKLTDEKENGGSKKGSGNDEIDF